MSTENTAAPAVAAATHGGMTDAQVAATIERYVAAHEKIARAAAAIADHIAEISKAHSLMGMTMAAQAEAEMVTEPKGDETLDDPE